MYGVRRSAVGRARVPSVHLCMYVRARGPEWSDECLSNTTQHAAHVTLSHASTLSATLSVLRIRLSVAPVSFSARPSWGHMASASEQDVTSGSVNSSQLSVALSSKDLTPGSSPQKHIPTATRARARALLAAAPAK